MRNPDFELGYMDDWIPNSELGGSVSVVADQYTFPLQQEPDEDSDGVYYEADLCRGTVIPEGVPVRELGWNRFALVDEDGVFDTNSPSREAKAPVYTIEDTAGCSCKQIIEVQGLGRESEDYGCSGDEMAA